MALIKYLIVAAIVMINISEIKGHGRLMDPVNRSSAFRKNLTTLENWDDDGNYCGGYKAHYQDNNGKCGVCGDNYSDKQPRENENGGYYGTGLIVKTYKAGSVITVTVDLTANHLGHYEFALCVLKGNTDLETEECFDKHKLELVTGGYKFPINTARIGDYLIDLYLPKNLRCAHCVLRWQYVAGNNWGHCPDGTGAIGCGNQETFRTCSDISID